jgi:hypothetical protein
MPAPYFDQNISVYIREKARKRYNFKVDNINRRTAVSES